MHGLLALVGGGVPLLESKVDAASEIVSQGLIDTGRRAGGRKSAEERKGLIGLASLERMVGVNEGIVAASRCRGGGESEKGNGRRNCRENSSRQNSEGQTPRCGWQQDHRTTLMGTPSCKGSPLVVPVAT